MLRWPLIAAAYTAPIILYFVSFSSFNGVFLAAYFGLLAGSLVVPAWLSENQQRPFLLGLAGGTLGSCLISLQMVALSIPLGRPPETAGGIAWALFSMIPMIALPNRLVTLREFLRRDGLDGQFLSKKPGIGVDHFALEFSIQRWFRHPDFRLVIMGDLALYFWAWSLLGLPLFLYSVSLLVLTCLAQRGLAVHFLAPYSPSTVCDVIDSANPRKEVKDVFVKPSTAPVLVIIAMVSVGAYTSLVPSPLSGTNLLVFLMLIVAYAAALAVYIWKTGSRT